MTLIHASCVAVDGAGVLIRGPSGGGKSDLALRLIDAGAELVADDYCELAVVDGSVNATAPQTIARKIEVRGYGIMEMPHRPSVILGLVVDLAAKADIDRFPDESEIAIEGVSLQRLTVDPDTVSAAAKVRLALKYGAHGTSNGIGR